MRPIETSEVNGFTVEIHHDPDAGNPHEDMTPGCEMTFSHKRYDLPNDAGIDFDLFGSWQEVGRHLAATRGALIILPVFMIDHSGLALRVGRDFSDVDPGSWDSGQVGFAYVTPQNWEDTQGKTWTGSDADQDQARNLITSDVEVYGYYLNGETYMYRITDFDGEEVDACGGFYGFDDVESEAKAAAEAAEHARKCTGTLNRVSGQVDHNRACPVHPEAGSAVRS